MYLQMLVTVAESDVLVASRGQLCGEMVAEDRRVLGDLRGVFADERAFERMDPTTTVYRVQSYKPLPEGVEGGLFYGTTFLSPGTVGDEYFMTKGHFHRKRDRGEFYWGIEGEGLLVLMGEDRGARIERVVPGSLHYVPGFQAHRVVNVGDVELAMGACWPSDAGHEYGTPFSVRVVRGPGGPQVVEATP